MLDRLRAHVGLVLALTPFLVFFVMFEAIPIVVLLLGSVGGIDSPTSSYLFEVFRHPVYRQAVLNSMLVAGASALIGAVVGTALGYGLTVTRHARIREALIALSNVTSDAGGVALAFGFITILGATGAITVAFGLLGVDLYSFFTLYSMTGLIVVYIYFQVPLMVVLMLPAFGALRREWREASTSLGGTSVDFWRRIGIPVLLPAIVAGTVLMFASGMGAFATALALMGARANLMTIQVSVLRQGEVIFDPSQADAMATVLLAIVAVSVITYTLIQRRTQRWLLR